MSSIIDRRPEGGPDVELDIVIEAPPDAVFDFLVVPDKVFRWLGSGGTIEEHTGSAFRIDYDNGHVASGTVVEIDRPRRLVWSWGWEHDEAIAPGSTTVAFDLTEHDGSTMVRLTHSGLPAAHNVDEHTGGWTHFMGRLQMIASGGEPD